MDKSDIIASIKADLGFDVNSLGISDDTIEIKLYEAIRKVSAYTPYKVVDSFPVRDSKVYMPKDTVTVLEVCNILNPSQASMHQDDIDLFSASRYLYQKTELSDPYIYLMQKNQLNTLQNFISIKDWRYERSMHTLYLSNIAKQEVSVIYLRRYRCFEEIEDEDVIQVIKEYALALCKIIEGTIRRKLQNAPGAIQMDGDALVSEGTAEKQRLDDWIPKNFAYLRMGIRI